MGHKTKKKHINHGETNKRKQKIANSPKICKTKKNG